MGVSWDIHWSWAMGHHVCPFFADTAVKQNPRDTPQGGDNELRILSNCAFAWTETAGTRITFWVGFVVVVPILKKWSVKPRSPKWATWGSVSFRTSGPGCWANKTNQNGMMRWFRRSPTTPRTVSFISHIGKRKNRKLCHRFVLQWC